MTPTREQCIAWAREADMPDLSCDPAGALHPALQRALSLAYAAGAADENEASARVAASYSSEPWKHDAAAVHVVDMVAPSIAAAIRARKEKK